METVETTLMNATIAQLEEAIQRKKKEEIPKLLDNIDLSKLIKICSDHLHNVANQECSYEYEQYTIFETAMETLFGDDVWDWYNEQE